MIYGSTEMPLHKVSNQRSYRKINIVLHHANLQIMHIFLEISKRCLKYHILTYNKNRLWFDTYQTAYDHS